MMTKPSYSRLVKAIENEWGTQHLSDSAVHKAAKEIGALFKDSGVAIFFYGSCLRSQVYEDQVLDFYVIVDSYKKAYTSVWMRVLNALIPPNVFYHETLCEGVVVRSKYAVISKNDFKKRCSKNHLNSAIWARFSQPVFPVFLKDKTVTENLAHDVANAVYAMVCESISMLPLDQRTGQEVWLNAFSLCYQAELRSEGAERAEELYEADPARYDTMASLVQTLMDGSSYSKDTIKGKVRWFFRRVNGKSMSLLRLMKASLTFKGGLDYLAWKIKRHSGVDIEITPWMRKHQFLGGIKAYVSLWGKGVIR